MTAPRRDAHPLSLTEAGQAPLSEVRPAYRRRAKWLPSIDTARCTGCGWCVAACPEHVLTLERTGWRKASTLIDAAACTGCQKCAVKCPFRVITMVANHQPD